MKDGSLVALVAIEACLLALTLGVFFALENPIDSLIWLLPEMQALAGRDGVYTLEVDYCQFGTSWKKPTKILTSCRELLRVARRCTGTSSCCSAWRIASQDLVQ